MAKKRRGRQPSTEPTPSRSVTQTSHLWAFLAVVIAAAALTGAAVRYFSEESFVLKERRLQEDYDREKARLQGEYQSRLRSLELQLGDQKQYFDVSRVLIPPAEIYKLPPSAKRFDLTEEVSFYVEDYPDSGWEFIRSTEFEVLEMMVGSEQAAIEAKEMGLTEALKQSQIFLFRYPEGVTLDLRGRIRKQGSAKGLTFFPTIAVQPVEHKFIASAFDIGRSRQVAELLKKSAQTSEESTRRSLETEIAEITEDLFRADFVGHVLNSMIDQGFEYVIDYKDVSYRILKLQKVRNVLFLQSVLVFQDATIEGLSETRNLVVHELILFVNSLDRSFLIRAVVPSHGSEGEYFDWVRRWLTGFRIEWSWDSSRS